MRRVSPPRYGCRVGFYRERVLLRLVNRTCSTARLTSLRAGVFELCDPVGGDVRRHLDELDAVLPPTLAP
jgi:hypothetical protein